MKIVPNHHLIMKIFDNKPPRAHPELIYSP